MERDSKTVDGGARQQRVDVRSEVKGSGSRLKLASLARPVGLSGGRMPYVVGGSHSKVDDSMTPGHTKMNAARATRTLLSRRKVILTRHFLGPTYACQLIDQL